MNVRGIVLGSAAFGAAYLFERQFGVVFKDVRRYDRLRKMSGDSPLAVQGVKDLGAALLRSRPGAVPKPRTERARHVTKTGGASDKSLFDAMRSDVKRYLTMRAM